jgi:putative transposase
VLDNFATHKAKKVKKASELNIGLISLPPSSPYLNPIEYLWKRIMRIISILCIESKDELLEIVRESCFDMAASLSSARMWTPRFLYDMLNMLC